MSERALPVLFLNLAGEMLYVLDQRLYAQKIASEKGKKSKIHFLIQLIEILGSVYKFLKISITVLEDIITNLFSERFLDEIFKPQEMCSKKAVKTIFERLAHTSIMRLNQNSMDKVGKKTQSFYIT